MTPSLEDFAALLGISPQTCRRHARRGLFGTAVVRKGRTWRVVDREAAARAFAANRDLTSAPANVIERAAQVAAPAPAPTTDHRPPPVTGGIVDSADPTFSADFLRLGGGGDPGLEADLAETLEDVHAKARQSLALSEHERLELATVFAVTLALWCPTQFQPKESSNDEAPR